MNDDLRLSRAVKCIALSIVLLTPIGCSTGGTEPDPGASPGSGTTSSSGQTGLALVAIGDSIPFNSPDDCSGCTGFVDQYAKAIEAATGKPVAVQNLSEHTGLTLPQLTEGLDSLQEELAVADVIVVGIAHNSFELNADAPCGKPVVNDAPDWSVVDAKCAAESAARHAPGYESLYAKIAQLRDGKPTILRTVNRYNDWIPAGDGGLAPEQALKTTTMHDAWNSMLCSAATASGFGCADIYHAFNGPDGTKPSADLLAQDYIHPSQRGNDVIAEVLKSQGFEPLG